MAHIVIVTHAHDYFGREPYLLGSIAGLWTDAGHRVTVVAGLGNWPDGDLAILHVDLSVIPQAYVEASRRYPVVVNGAVLDIRKSLVSRCLLRRDDDWTGPVIVKTDLNCGGVPELRLRHLNLREDRPAAVPARPESYSVHPYPILESARDVPAAVWDNPGLVVERFLPEQDDRGFWMRAWVFLGDRERCTRYLGTHPIVKAGSILAREPVPVPDELRAERQRLGFDYGKFDFVVRDDRPILFDANRTPSSPPPPVTAELTASNANLARGLDAWLNR
jgi:hypothetical protein